MSKKISKLWECHDSGLKELIQHNSNKGGFGWTYLIISVSLPRLPPSSSSPTNFLLSQSHMPPALYFSTDNDVQVWFFKLYPFLVSPSPYHFLFVAPSCFTGRCHRFFLGPAPLPSLIYKSNFTFIKILIIHRHPSWLPLIYSPQTIPPLEVVIKTIEVGG